MSDHALRVGGSGPKPTVPSNQFTVHVIDIFHMHHEDDCYTEGSYATLDEAVKVAKQIAFKSLLHLAERGTTPKKLYERYCTFGDDPFVTDANGVLFSGWDYAKHLCDLLSAHRERRWAQGHADNLDHNILGNVRTN